MKKAWCLPVATPLKPYYQVEMEDPSIIAFFPPSHRMRILEHFSSPLCVDWIWAHLDSNQGPTGYEPVALPAELWAHKTTETL
jgi:hypothetical protein